MYAPLAEIIPVYKKNNPLDKENYHHVSLLSHVSKIFAKITYTHMEHFMSPNSVNLVYSGHLWERPNLSAIDRCLLYRGLTKSLLKFQQDPISCTLAFPKLF